MTPRESSGAASRIVGGAVPPLVPASGPVYVLLIGEAPGPRGADKSGVPFFGDAAGKHLYHALAGLNAVVLPDDIDAMPWDGATFATRGLRPIAHGVALGNAFDRCPTDDGTSFRAPARSELEGADNIARLLGEIDTLRERGLRGIVTLGRVATKTMDVVLSRASLPTLARHAVPHPSAQGLLSMAPDRGKGARMSDLQAQWMTHCQRAVLNAGFPDRGEETYR